MAEEPRRPEHVQSFARGLAVIRAFGERPELTLSDVARATGLTRAAARRFLLTLVDLGYVRSDGRTFALRPRVLELGYAYLSTLGLDDVAAPHMEQLVASIRESSSISVLDGDDIVYVVRVPTSRIMTVTIAVGTRFPAYPTSMGRVLLAALPPAALDAYLERVEPVALTRRTVTDRAALRAVLGEVAAKGYALVDQELEDGLRSVAVPIVDRSGAVVAALNASAHASRATLEDLRRRMLPQLQATAARINDDLRAVGRTAARAQ
ncbi:helix-turn-helix domain-containing protein [Acidimicrobiaceae bacterium USS-CC1]|uniref:Helix-turn-helix domain-containing protein n=1 Tax=Acidiferrimicrobium australe TaxID=2664430 RepID=A0ABW9QRY8_9ACTN|nr:helix-turn-helix domain-containing protein [Acidiferrimicrobium australe]